MVSHRQLEYYSLPQLIEKHGIDYVVINIIDNIDHYPLDELICSNAAFYKGAASFEWLENQSITKLLILQREAVKINDDIKRANNKSNSK